MRRMRLISRREFDERAHLCRAGSAGWCSRVRGSDGGYMVDTVVVSMLGRRRSMSSMSKSTSMLTSAVEMPSKRLLSKQQRHSVRAADRSTEAKDEGLLPP